MDQYVKSIVPIIEVKYESFTQVEKSIADFFLTNREDVDLSAKSVSEQLFVSMAALSRFAKKCGFQGYREFIYSYKESIAESQRSQRAMCGRYSIFIRRLSIRRIVWWMRRR